MNYLQRIIRSIVLVALLTGIIITQAQDDLTTTVVGSAIVHPVLQDVAEFGEVDITLDVSTTGTSAGFDQFCTGEADMQAASRAINIDEETVCVENGIEYAEFIIGYNIVAFINTQEDDYLSCLTSNEIDRLFAPSAAVELTDWSGLNPADLGEDAEPPYPELPITVVLPPADTLTSVTLDNLVDGIGLRDDAIVTDVADIIETVNTTEGAIGVVPLQAAIDTEADTEIFILDVDFGDVESGCEAPSANNVDNRLYTAATPLYVYVNREQLDTLSDYLDVLLTEEAEEPIIAAGFTPVSEDGIDVNQRILSGELPGRVPEEDEEPFVIPPVLTGEVNIGGTSFAYGFVNSVVNTLAGSQQEFTVNVNTIGGGVAAEEMCAGEINIAFTTEAITCEDDDPTVVTIPVGTQAVVLVGNLEDDYTTCLTTEQITTIWGAPATDTITNWSDLGEPLPDQEMVLFGIREGNLLGELLLSSPEGAPLPVRVDTEIDFDPLYRAAATANVSGALTYMSWLDYQSVLANEQDNIQLVSVDGGSGCVVPSEETIVDGSYPLAMPLSLNIAQSALTDINIQSIAWSFFTDNNYRAYETNDLVGIDFGDLPVIRDTLAVEFNIAATAAAEDAAAEATGEPDAEATIEAEAEATEETNNTDAEATDAEESSDAEATDEVTEETEDEEAEDTSDTDVEESSDAEATDEATEETED